MSPRAVGAGHTFDHCKGAYRARAEENHDRCYGGYPGIVANNRLSGMSVVPAVHDVGSVPIETSNHRSDGELGRRHH